MKENQEPYGGGMGLSRIINGKRVHLSHTKKADQQRIDKVVEMSVRHARLLVEQDWYGLRQLAQEYAELYALTTANKIMLEIPSMIGEARSKALAEHLAEEARE